MKYLIQDWAGNVLLNGKTFDSFEDGWSYIDGELTDRLGLTEDDYQDYFVVESGPLREKRLLEPNSPMQGWVRV